VIDPGGGVCITSVGAPGCDAATCCVAGASASFPAFAFACAPASGAVVGTACAIASFPP
jgi:hypothetical protein